MVTPWLEKNPRAAKALKFGRDQQFVVNPNGIAELCEDLKQCPRHSATPLHSLPALAERLGLGEIRVKDESQRFGFGAFKALGGVIAVYNVLSGAVGAKLFGNRCVIFLPKFTSAEKEAAIRARGAEVIRIDGDYDTDVAACKRRSQENGWTII